MRGGSTRTLTLAIAAFASLACPYPSLRAAEQNACKALTFEGHPFTACSADPARARFQLFLRRSDGTLFGTLSALPQNALLFATNAGMFTPEYAPAGLYVEEGKEFKALNTHEGGGNFHLAPNGVFWIKGGVAHVSTTADYAALAPAPDLATQSGPMLVIAGSIHPKFDENGPSRFVRNGIGVSGNGHVTIAISEEPVSFGVFARLFRDALGCANALYLDGSVSRLFIAGEARATSGPQLGPLLGVYTKE